MNPLAILSLPARQRRSNLSRELHSEVGSVSSVEAYQLDKLNWLWANACDRIPYYQGLLSSGLPCHFASLDDFSASVPIFTKKILQAEGLKAFSPLEKGKFTWSASGGSTTAEPVRFPVNKSEAHVREGNEWYLRSLIGISPNDSSFRVWGHRHVLGNGPQRILKSMEREIKDKALGVTRLSAYNLAPEDVRDGIAKLLNSQVSYVLGFSKALELYAEEILALKCTPRLPPLKGVIATAECFSSPQSRLMVETAFGCPIYMEYGSMETGPIAQETCGGGYNVSWTTYLLEASPTDEGTFRMLVTSLYPRAFPLFRYDLGDLVSGFDRKVSIRRFGSIDGRSNPLFISPSGKRIHSVPIIHALDPTTGSVSLYQVGLRGDRIAGIFLMLLPGKTLNISIDELRSRLNKTDQGLGEIPIKFISKPFLTPAGKRPVFVQLGSQEIRALALATNESTALGNLE